ncbi:thioredoxin reductase [Pararhizobium capsulatum DSM 1112]|uniref:Thioredoxin reductase n=1 Tax=Pararhizobium capsulatum DSM 1112 TaxID=1121113 RepID=A0ABU0BQL9_9HYPH|nr:FAD-dependent oxidoreductase [Pararhizobium capsulatum]MDQ0320252.1 thioredoxin reductase [Pararhizobium capsulatum DSM 1112]
MTTSKNLLPVAVIGAGPVGLAAAARLVERGIQPLVFEKGVSVGAALLEWGHVRVFSPWRYNIDDAARALLEATDWTAPAPDFLPNGREIVERYLVPLSRVPGIAEGLMLGAIVKAVTRKGLTKLASAGREDAPFVVRYTDGQGERDVVVSAVIDASGTWSQPNPMGPDGLPVAGEEASTKVSYGIPDVVGSLRQEFIGKRTLVVGSGHSAINVAIALMDLQDTDPNTEIFWALKHRGVDRLLGGGLNDQLPERGALGLAAKKAMDDGRLNMLTSFSAESIVSDGGQTTVLARTGDQQAQLTVDQIVVATGFRPDFSFLRELRIEVDPAVEAPPALAPLIDPNFHSCGTVPPHGVEELKHPEKDFYIVGSKSYGRAPTFLMMTGYEQVRSVVAEIAGDHEAARRVELVLPETGVCSVFIATASGGCCGGPAPTREDACCVSDAIAKDEGKPGCGCGSVAAPKRVVESV